MLRVEKKTVRYYELVFARSFMNFKKFVEARKYMSETPKTCFACNHKFEDSETIYLARSVNDINRIVCESCAKKINEP